MDKQASLSTASPNQQATTDKVILGSGADNKVLERVTLLRIDQPSTPPPQPRRKRGGTRINIDEEKLAECLKKDLSGRKIALELGVSQGTACRRIREAKGKVHPPGRQYKISNEALLSLYGKCKSASEASETHLAETGCKISAKQISFRWMHKLGLAQKPSVVSSSTTSSPKEANAPKTIAPQPIRTQTTQNIPDTEYERYFKSELSLMDSAKALKIPSTKLRKEWKRLHPSYIHF